jgi:hypothetical protein
MSGTESKSPESPKYSREDVTALDTINMIKEIVEGQIENGQVWNEDYPEGVRTITHSELQTPDDDYSEVEQVYRSIADEEITKLYRDALEDIYPELGIVASADEMIDKMLALPSLPEWSGEFHISEFGSSEGNFRAFLLTQVKIENEGSVFLASIVDDDFKKSRRYSVGRGIHGKIWQTVSEAVEKTDQEDEFIDKVHPSQRQNLIRVLQGDVSPDELDNTLLAIESRSNELMSEHEMTCLIEYAKVQYEFAVMMKVAEINEAYKYTDSTRMDDLTRMVEIIDERKAQLDGGTY